MTMVRRRGFTVLTAAGYLLAISASALFHDHHQHPGEDQPRPGVSVAHSTDEHDCSICQFLAQKPAPAAEVAPVSLSTLVEDVASPAPVRTVGGVFTAWHSRAPPIFA